MLTARSLANTAVLLADESAIHSDQTPFSPAQMSLALLKKGVEEYQRRGVPASKLVLALPWFGMDWAENYTHSFASLSYDIIPIEKREGGACNASTPSSGWHERDGCYQFTCDSTDRLIVPGQKALYPHCATAMGFLRDSG